MAKALSCDPRQFKQLVGRGRATASGKLPQNRVQWQLLEKVVWMQRVDDPSQMVPICGDADHFIEHFAPTREDTAHFVASQRDRVQTFFNGNLRSNGVLTNEYGRREVPYKWRRIGALPDDAKYRVQPHIDSAVFIANLVRI